MFFVLFTANLLLRLDAILSKFVFATKFACANLVLKTSAAEILNSGVVIYLAWLWPLSFFSISVIFILWSIFLIRLLTSGILFLTVVNAAFVGKLVTSGILFSISVNLIL